MKLFRPLLLTFREASIVCIFPQKSDLVGQGEDEYLVWTGGGEPSGEDAVRTYENAYGREWFLTFNYSADIAYPVAVIEAGAQAAVRERQAFCTAMGDANCVIGRLSNSLCVRGFVHDEGL